MVTTCGRCGQVHDRCRAHNRSGGPCRKFPTPGMTCCHMHGSKAPQVKHKAAVRETERFLLKQVKRHLAKNPARRGYL